TQEGVPGETLVARTTEAVLPRGVGLPGRMWVSRRPDMIENVLEDASVPPASATADAHLPAAYGFPIVVRDEVLGVMDFRAAELRDPEPEMLEMLGTIGTQIGQFVEHRRAESQLLQA